MSMFLFFLSDPDIVVSVMPEVISVPGVSPYNSFPLTCIVDEPGYLQVLSSINWMRGNTILNISNGYRVDETIVSSTQRHLVLDVDNAATGSYSFLCASILAVPGDPPLVRSATVNVEVRGIIHCTVYIQSTRLCGFFKGNISIL